jgi:shikimate kinase
LNKNLVLTGMMGVGKSTVGKSLSDSLNMNFIDTDKIIEKKTQMSVEKIFKYKGEKYFRDMEKEVCLSSLKEDNSVIALGGGAFMDQDLRDIIIAKCVSFWLDLGTADLAKRLMVSKKRPLANGKDLEKNLLSIYDQRKSIYKLANFKITCDEKNIQLIVSKITQIYENK